MKEGVEVDTAGESGDKKWAMLQKPVSGWVPGDKLGRVLVSEVPTKRAAPRSSDEFVTSPSKNESGINLKICRRSRAGVVAIGGGASALVGAQTIKCKQRHEPLHSVATSAFNFSSPSVEEGHRDSQRLRRSREITGKSFVHVTRRSA